MILYHGIIATFLVNGIPLVYGFRVSTQLTELTVPGPRSALCFLLLEFLDILMTHVQGRAGSFLLVRLIYRIRRNSQVPDLGCGPDSRRGAVSIASRRGRFCSRYEFHPTFLLLTSTSTGTWYFYRYSKHPKATTTESSIAR